MRSFGTGVYTSVYDVMPLLGLGLHVVSPPQVLPWAMYWLALRAVGCAWRMMMRISPINS